MEGDTLGRHFDFDESWEPLVHTLLSGGAVETVETVDTYGWLLTRYEPIFDSAGNCACYVGADLSMWGVRDYVTGYVIRIAVISGIFLIGCILLGMRLHIGGYGVSVEVYITNGLPYFEVVGLPDAAVKEARERVHAAPCRGPGRSALPTMASDVKEERATRAK